MSVRLHGLLAEFADAEHLLAAVELDQFARNRTLCTPD